MRSILVGLCAAGLASCGKPVTFQGQSTMVVAATPVVATAPPAPPPRVEVREDKIEIHEKIQFDVDKASIKDASADLMNEIVAVISKNPQIKKIRIEGHASEEGDPAHNRVLSDSRAKSVMKYLTSHGISAKELVAVGYGSDRPIADNSTEDGREKNRRVEFVIVDQDAKTGADEKHVDASQPKGAP